MEVGERQAILRRLATLIREHARELAYLECLSSGIPMRHLSLGQIPRAALNFEFFAEFIGQCAGQVYTQDPRYMTFVTREPVGVAALIGPWNAPLALTSMKIAGCIAFGNCCVAKPAEQTPLAVARLMDLIVEAGVPAGVVNMVCGRGAVTGEALIRHPEVDLVSFTGGTATGRTVMAAAGSGLKPCSLELGGKSANIVFASADLERALDGALLSIFSNNGQQCLAGSRILVERSIAPAFIDAFVARTAQLKIGDPMDAATEIGPLAFRAHLDRVLSFVAWRETTAQSCSLAVRAQRALTGGSICSQPRSSLRTAVRASARKRCSAPSPPSWCSTISITRSQSPTIRASAWSPTSGPSTCRPCCAPAGRCGAGVVWVNTPMVRELRAPFGGVKESGMGREGGQSSMQFYTTEKTTAIPVGSVPMARLGLA